MDDPQISDAAQEAYSVVVTLIAVVAAVAVALVVAVLLRVIVGRLGRRSPVARDMSVRMRRPARVVLLVIAVIIAVQVSVPRDGTGLWWRAPLLHALFIGLIAAGGWLVGSVAFVLEDRLLVRYDVTSSTDDRRARRMRTQIVVIRRLTVSILVICVIAGILMTFPAARAAGASIFASAGLLSIVAGLAAQTSLANVFAGMQIAFTDAIRSDDIVVLEGEWGRIEEITMTYVVVHLWDDRRLILPSTYFTTTPFENWTRRSSELLGTVEIDLDWEVPVGEMRGALKALLAESNLWDDRVGILQVTEATAGRVQVRALVSAADAPTLFDLRCYVREGLVDWLQREAPQALPRLRLGDATERPVPAPVEPAEHATEAGDGAVDAEVPGRADASIDDATRAEPHAPAAQSPAAKVGHGPGADRSGAKGPERSSWRRRGLRRVPRVGETSPEGAGADSGSSHGGSVGARVPAMPAPSEDATVVLETVSTASESALFSGTAEGLERSRAFSGPGQDVYDEREETAERNHDGELRDSDSGGDADSVTDSVTETDTDGPGDRAVPDDGRAGSEAPPTEVLRRSEPAESAEERSRRAPRGGDPTGSGGDGDGGNSDGGHSDGGGHGGDY